MKERVRLMKCQNKKKNVKRAVAGIIFLSVIAIILSAYGVTQMYSISDIYCLAFASNLSASFSSN